MKSILFAVVALFSISAFAEQGSFDCSYTEHIITSGPEDQLKLSLSSSVTRDGDSDIIQRVGRVTVVAELESFRTISLKLVDTTDVSKAKRNVRSNEYVTISLPEATGRTRDGRVYQGVTLSCAFKTF